MDAKELGRELMRRRLDLNLSQRDLAALGGTDHLTSTSISKIERGERYPNLATLERIAKALRCEIIIDPRGTRIRDI